MKKCFMGLFPIIGCIMLVVACTPRMKKYEYIEISMENGDREVSAPVIIEAESDSDAVLRAYESFLISKKVQYVLGINLKDTSLVPSKVIDFKLYGENSSQNLKDLAFEGKETKLKSLYKEIVSPEEEKYQKIEEQKAERIERGKEALKKLKRTYDDVSNITWYENKYYTHYTNTNRASLYMGVQNNNVWLRLRMSYEGENWIFFEKAYLSYDGNTHEVRFNEYRDKKTENEGGRVWEWLDIQVDEELANFLNNMVTGKSVKMRLSGKYTETRNLSRNEIKGFTDVLRAYNLMK